MLLQGNIYGVVWSFGSWLSVVGIWLSVLASSQSYRQPTTDNLQPTTDNLQPTTYNLLFIDILFLNNQTTSFVWKTVYLAGVCSSHFLYVLVLSSRQLLPSCP